MFKIKIFNIFRLKKVLDLFFIPFLFFIFILSCSKALTPEELNRLKEGKSFWTWEYTNGKANIQFVEKGQGNNHIFLIHGFGANIYTWHFLINPLAEAGYHVWAIDLIGFGLSDKPTNITYNSELFLKLIISFMKDKEINSANIIGNSMGGGLAAQLALSRPELVKTLILIDSLTFPIELPLPLLAAKSLGKNFKISIDEKVIVRETLKNIVYDRNKITEEQIEAYAYPLKTPGGIEAFLNTLNHYNVSEIEKIGREIKNLKSPTLIIWGEKDYWIPISHFNRLKKEFPKAQFQLIPNCGHIPQEECPKLVLDTILNFLNKFSKN